MESDENSTQVRRTARARKVNPKFIGNDTDESYMQLVGRITASNYSSNKDADKDESKNDADNVNHGSNYGEQSIINWTDSEGINIALKTISVKKFKKLKYDQQQTSGLKATPSVIVRCRSSTESEVSEENVMLENERKRKYELSGENDIKKLKTMNDSNPEGDNITANSTTANSVSSLATNIKIASVSSSQLLQRAFVPLPICHKLDKNQSQIVKLTPQSTVNFPGKQLKIVSLKLKKDSLPISFSPNKIPGKLVLGEGGPVELKIIKKEIYPISSSSLPPIISPKVVKDKFPIVPKKSQDENEEPATGNWFSSDGEDDDIPLNKLLVKQGPEKKKKMPKDKAQKVKITKNKIPKTEGKKTSDQDDLPLTALIKKKSKVLSKNISEKVKKKISMNKANEDSTEAMTKDSTSIYDAESKKLTKMKKKQTSEELSSKEEETSGKMKIIKIKEDADLDSSSNMESMKTVKKKKKLTLEELSLKDDETPGKVTVEDGSVTGSAVESKKITKKKKSLSSEGLPLKDEDFISSSDKESKKMKKKFSLKDLPSQKEKLLSRMKFSKVKVDEDFDSSSDVEFKASAKKKRKLSHEDMFSKEKELPSKVKMGKVKENEDVKNKKKKNAEEFEESKSLLKQLHEKKIFKKLNENKIKRIEKLKSSKADFKFTAHRSKVDHEKKKKTKDGGKMFQKLRFKFPKKLAKSVTEDEPVASETTNVVISVSGIEGDYACVAIPKPEETEPEKPKPKCKKKKVIKEDSLSRQYTIDSGLVLEDVPIKEDEANALPKVESPTSQKEKERISCDLMKSESIKKGDELLRSEEKLVIQKIYPEEPSLPVKEQMALSDSIPKFQHQKMKSFKTPISETSKDSKSSSLVNEESGKRRSIDKRESFGESEVKKSKDREKKKEEREKLNVSITKAEVDFDKSRKSDSEHKKHKSRKESLTEEVKTEEKHIKKERNESKESSKKFNKESTDNKSEKMEKDNNDSISKKIEKAFHSSRLERQDSKSNSPSSKRPSKEDPKTETLSPKKFSKEEKDVNTSPKKPHKETKTDLISKLVEKENVKIEKDMASDDSRELGTPGSKIKKKENFEEALLNIPLPKLPKHKRDKDSKKEREEKLRKNVKDKKYDVKQEIHLVKHRENENEREETNSKESLKSSLNTDEKSGIKYESHFKEIKKEEKSHRREERRHSYSVSNRHDKRKHEHDSKDGITKHSDSSNDEREKKRRREEKESRHSSSHKKHKKEHSESHRRHSSSSYDKKKHRMEEGDKYDYKYNKEKTAIKSEDRKDVIINKIIEGKQTYDIKRERELSYSNSRDTKSIQPKLLESESTVHPVCPKNEMKSEVVIDEEHLVSIGKDPLKEENSETMVSVSASFVKSEIASQTVAKEEASAAVFVDDDVAESLQTELPPYEMKTEIPKDVQVTSEEFERVEENIKNISAEILSVNIVTENETVEKDQNGKEPLITSESDIHCYQEIKDNVESDLGILDELRTLKQMSIEERMKSEIKFNKDEIEERINTSGSQVINSSGHKADVTGDIEVDEKSELEDIFGENEKNSENDVSELRSKVIELERKKKDEGGKAERSDDSKIPENSDKPANSQEDFLSILMSDSENSSEHFSNKTHSTQDNEIDALKEENIKDIRNSESTDDQSEDVVPQSPTHVTSDELLPISLPSDAQDTSAVNQSPSSPLTEESTPASPSEPDEGFSEVSSHTREPISSEEDNIFTEDEDKTATISECSSVDQRELSAEEKEEIENRNREIVEERMNGFEHLDENLYLVEKVRNKRSKEAKRMVCDCTLTKEEITNGEMGCADDCLNRLLMIECGSRCPLRDRCMNKKFQQKDNRNVEVFNAEEKGCGVRTAEEIKQGTFIMEYIGEVFDTKEFKRRRKEYAKSGSPHFYFMAMRSDRLIDATRKGNISRFVNHSCSPNAETQKWTVNGDIRVGFFATRDIPIEEEITFDYRLERYGREPQKCYCGTPECRGWLGEPPEKKTKEEKEEDRRREMRDKQKREVKRYRFEDMDLEDEIEKLTARGLRNRQDTLNLSRLMVRCEDSESRLVLLKILELGEEASKRLFLDYHGLKLLWSWMVDISSSHKCIPLKLEILETLKSLPITNKTQVTDSKVMDVVERWSKAESKLETKEVKEEEDNKLPSVQEKKLSDGSDSDTETSETKDSDPSPSDTVSPDDSSQDSNEVTVTGAPSNKDSAETTSSAVSNDINAKDEDSIATESDVAEFASSILSVWSELKEAFKIPKKQRIEMMKEHEREVEKEYEKYMDRNMDDGDEDRKRAAYYESWRYTGDRDKQRDVRDVERKRERRWSKWKDYYENEVGGLSKEERRERFAKQVAKEEEEARQRKLQEEMWNLHLERCNILGHDPYFTPIFDPSGQYYWDPAVGTWQSYIGPSGNLPVPAAYGMQRPEGNENISPNIPTNQMFLSGVFYPLPHTPVTDEEGRPLTAKREESIPALDLASIPLPGEIPLSKGSPTGSPGSKVHLRDDSMDMANGIETPPMPAPGPVTIKLPQKWKIARDSDRRIYFYHSKTRHTQWDLPTDDIHSKLMERYGLTSDSESDLDSDSDSSTSTDSEDFSSDEDENEEEEVEADPVSKIESQFDEKMIRRPKGKKVRSERLVQERVISPILFRDRETARRERREAKDKAREEARKERWTQLIALKAGMGKSTLTSKQDQEKEIVPSEDTVLSPNENDDDEHLEEQLLKFSRKQKSEGKHKAKSKERAATALADTSDLARKIKDNFRSRMATYIVSVLNPYRKPECKKGRITCNEDFKYLARKLTHFVMVKELKQLPSIDGLDCSESVKHKTKEFVRKYMGKYGEAFKRDPNDTKEY